MQLLAFENPLASSSRWKLYIICENVWDYGLCAIRLVFYMFFVIFQQVSSTTMNAPLGGATMTGYHLCIVQDLGESAKALAALSLPRPYTLPRHP